MVEAEDRIWVTVPGFPDYQISNDGRLRRETHGSNSKPGHLIRPKLNNGYPEYGLNAPDGKRAHLTAHRLVAVAFLSPGRPDQPFVLHKNDNKLDARDTNLRWGTAQDNTNDAIRNGKILVGPLSPIALHPWDRPRGDGHPFAKLTEDQVRVILRAPESAETLANRYDVSPDTIMAIRRAKNWRHITDPAYGAALIEGAKNDTRPPRKRKGFSVNQRFELLKRENYRCHLCKGLIYPGQGWDISHEIPIELGGPDDETNRRAAHRKCHRVHTATVDIPAIAKAKRVKAKHYAGTASARPMRGGRTDVLKRQNERNHRGSRNRRNLASRDRDRETGHAMSQHAFATIERVARELSTATARTPKAIETRLQFYLSRSTIREVLGHLVREGRAVADGDIYQKRYRLAVPVCQQQAAE